MGFDTLIIGAGAAGLICAAQAPGKCLVIDHAKPAGEKIRISGGGRCNFTNLYALNELAVLLIKQIEEELGDGAGEEGALLLSAGKLADLTITQIVDGQGVEG